MAVVSREEIQMDGHTYIKETYTSGKTNIYLKSDPIPDPIEPEPEPVDPPVTNEQLLEEVNNLQSGILDLMEGQTTIYEMQLAASEGV